MANHIHLISSHPLLIRAVAGTFATLKGLELHSSPVSALAATPIVAEEAPSLFLLDACSSHTDLGPLAARYRAHFPGSKFLALLAPGETGATLPEKIRLFFWGIDGFVELHETWQKELPHAVQNILKGQLWVPSEVLLAFVTHAKSILDAQLLHGHFLTAREAQVLQLLMRRLTNKDISSTLRISERTVKFHVSNILSKLQLEDRHAVSPLTNLTAKTLPQAS
jgi:two-component system, NarL family, response regulator LiaR